MNYNLSRLYIIHQMLAQFTKYTDVKHGSSSSHINYQNKLHSFLKYISLLCSLYLDSTDITHPLRMYLAAFRLMA